MLSYRFYKEESFIHDFLSFPGMIHMRDEDLLEEDDYIKKIIPESGKLAAEKMRALLMPHREKLSDFYYRDDQDRSFYRILSIKNPIMGNRNPGEYFKTLKKKSPDELLKDVLYAISYFEQDTGEEDREAALVKTDDLLKHPEKIMGWLSGLSLSSDARWGLLSFTQDPIGVLNRYIVVMEEIYPVFSEFYEGCREDVTAYGETFTDRLNEIKGDSLSQVSNGLVSESLLPQDEEVKVVVSMVNAYAVMLNRGCLKPFISWGYDLEKVFTAMAVNEKNRLLERVLVFKNLGDRTRYEVVQSIAAGITATKIIAENLGVSSATISYHLNNLVTAKIIFLEHHEGKYVYRINRKFIMSCLDGLKEDILGDEPSSYSI